MTDTNLVPIIDALAYALRQRERAETKAYDSLQEGSRAQDRALAFSAGVSYAISAMFEPRIAATIEEAARVRLLETKP